MEGYYHQSPRVAAKGRKSRRGQIAPSPRGRANATEQQPVPPRPPAAAPATPMLEQLPAPPKAKQFALPEEPGTSSTAVVQERRLLDTLLGHLAGQENLSEPVRALVTQASHSTARTEAKALHKLAAQRQDQFRRWRSYDRTEPASSKAGLSTHKPLWTS